MITESKIQVRYQETDQMSIVYHANYLVWFEIGRTDLIRGLGMTYASLEERGFLLPVLEANCKYIQAAKYDDDLIIRSKVLQLKGAKITFGYEVIREKDQKVLAEGYTIHTFTTFQLKPINLRSKMPDVYEGLMNSIQ